MSTQNMYKNVHSSFIHDSTKQKQLRCPSIDEWLNKWENIQQNKEQTTDTHYLYQSPTNQAK